MPRLFFALQPPASQRAALLDAALPLIRALGGRPVPVVDLHLTLCFLGEVPEARVAELAGAIEHVRPAAVELAFDRIDAWLPARVLSLLPEGGSGLVAVKALAASLRQAAGSVGVVPDPKPFTAHVTVARKVPAMARQARPWPLPLPRPLPFSGQGFALMHSTGVGEGPRYAVLRTWTPPADAASAEAGS